MPSGVFVLRLRMPRGPFPLGCRPTLRQSLPYLQTNEALNKKKTFRLFQKRQSRENKVVQCSGRSPKPLPVDPQIKQLQEKLTVAQKPVPLPPEIARLRRALDQARGNLPRKRIVGAQDLAWAIINTPAFLFNR